MFGLLVAAGAKLFEEVEEAAFKEGLGDGEDENANRADEGEANEGAAEEEFSEDSDESSSEGAGVVNSCTRGDSNGLRPWHASGTG